VNAVLLISVLALPVHAGTLAQARAAERAGAWNDAAAIYQGLLAEGSGPAERRMAWLQARQDADGDWDGLEALDVSRRGGGAESARVLVEDGGASELVRHEACLWLAGQHLDRDDPGLALTRTDSVWEGRLDLPRPVLGQLVLLRAAALSKMGRFDEAREVEAMLAIETTAVRPTETDRAERAARNQFVALISAAVVLVLGLGLLPSAWRGWREQPRLRPWGLIPLVVLLGGTALLAEGRESGSARWWAPLMAGAVTVHLISAGAGRGRGPWGQALVGGLAAIVTLALAWLSLWATQTLSTVGL
jgi:hypothetical protein